MLNLYSPACYSQEDVWRMEDLHGVMDKDTFLSENCTSFQSIYRHLRNSGKYKKLVYAQYDSVVIAGN